MDRRDAATSMMKPVEDSLGSDDRDWFAAILAFEGSEAPVERKSGTDDFSRKDT